MIKIRLLKTKGNQIYQLLESVDLPSIESNSELNMVAVSLGKLLDKYVDNLNDPNIVSSLLDTTIDNWTIRDFESILAVLVDSEMFMTITVEDQPDVKLEPGDIMYLLVDNSVKHLEILPYSKYVAVEKSTTAVDIVTVNKALLTENYFDPQKFKNNPFENYLENLQESFNLIGGYDQYSLSRLSNLFYYLNKSLLVIRI